MGALSIKDVVDLAKAGYKYSEVKELLTLTESQNTESTGTDTGDTHTTEVEDIQNTNIKNEPDQSTDSESDAESIDYKKLYEDSQAKLKEAQQTNIKTDISGIENKSNEQHFEELVRSFI